MARRGSIPPSPLAEDWQYDPGVTRELRRIGHPARSGEALAFRGMTEGLGVGQWSRPS